MVSSLKELQLALFNLSFMSYTGLRLPATVNNYSVIRSPFVYKSSREHFSILKHKHLWLVDFYTVSIKKWKTTITCLFLNRNSLIYILFNFIVLFYNLAKSNFINLKFEFIIMYCYNTYLI
jgi:hypothetical protein